MARRFVPHADFLQSVPAKSRAKAREASKHMRVAPDAPKPAKAPLIARKHYARVIGGATIGALLALALLVSPGEKPAYGQVQKPLAQGLNSVHTPMHKPRHSGHNRAS